MVVPVDDATGPAFSAILGAFKKKQRMKITHLWQRARNAWQRIAGQAGVEAAPGVVLETVKERFAQLQPPALPAAPGPRLHTLIKLGPIPLPRAVRWEGHGMYALAWAGTAGLVWGAWRVPVDWLLGYGLAAVVVFAILFRLEGPRTRHERRMCRTQNFNTPSWLV